MKTSPVSHLQHDTPLYGLARKRGFALCRLLCGLMILAALLTYTTPAKTEISAIPRPNTAAKSWLTWANGDRMPGELIGLTKTELLWKTPFFKTPLTLDLKYLRSVDFASAHGHHAAEEHHHAHDHNHKHVPQDKKKQRGGGLTVVGPGEHLIQAPSSKHLKTSEPIRFALRGGDVMYGRLAGVTDAHIIVESRRHGRCRLRRSEVMNFRRMNLPTVRSGEPTDLAGWKTLRPGRKLSDWKRNELGQIATNVVGAELFRDVQLPENSEIDLSLSWKGKPGFLIGFATPNFLNFAFEPVKLETWGDELVLQTLESNADFEQIQTIKRGSHSIQFRLYWNQKAGELSVFSRHGKLLGKKASAPKKREGKTGLYIRNKGSDLTIVAVRVSKWNGATPKAAVDGLNRMHLVDGDVVYGRLTGYDKSNASLLVDEPSGKKRSVKVDQITGVYMTDDVSSADKKSQIQIAYHDGSLIRGAIDSVERGAVRLRTSYSDQPIASKLDGARRLILRSDGKIDTLSNSLLEFDGGKLHGEMASFGSALGWRPMGGVNTIPLPANCRARIGDHAKQNGNNGKQPAQTHFADLICLRSGDIIPCHVEKVDATHLHIKSEFSDATRIPFSQVKAVEFNSHVDLPVGDFGGQWVVRNSKKNAIERTDEKVVFRGPGNFSHPNIFQGGDVRFDIKWNPQAPSAITFNLGVRNVRGRRQSSILIYFRNNQVYVRGMDRGMRQARMRPEKRGGKITLRFSIKRKRLHVFIGKKKMLEMPLGKKGLQNYGMMMSVQKLNAGRRRNGQKVSKELLTFTNLKVGRSDGALHGLSIDEEKRDLVLTVPRMRKKSPSTHVLVAKNGDLLRGRLMDMTNDHVHFVSKLTDFMFSRARLAGVIWLDAEESEPPPSPDAARAPVRTVMRNGATFSFTPDKVVDGTLVGKSDVLGQCRIPINQIHEILVGNRIGSIRKAPYADWVVRPAVEPKFASTGGGSAGGFGVDSPLVGTTPKDFEAKLLGKGNFRLSDHAGKVVVLDFWATWCGPCVRAMPELIKTVKTFPPDKVVLIAVNQEENAKTINEFLKTRGWDVTVALDKNATIGRQFQADDLPQTVIIGPDGKIALLHIGAHPNLEKELTAVLQKILDGPKEKEPVLPGDPNRNAGPQEKEPDLPGGPNRSTTVSSKAAG